MPQLDTDSTRDAAAEALARSKHPEAVDKLLEALDASLEPIEEKKPAKAKKAAPKKATAKKATATPAKEINPAAVARARGCAILTALAAFTDSRIAERAAPLLASHGAPAARALVGSGSKAHLEAVVATLDGTDETLFASAVAAAKKLGPKVAFTRLAPALELGAKAKPVEVARAVAVLGGVEKNKAWLKPVTALLEKFTNAEVLAAAGEAIQRIGDKAAVKPLLAAVSRRDLDYRVGHSLVEALGQLGDASIIPTLLDSFDERRDYYGWWSIQRAVLALADRSTVEQVRELFSKQNEKTQKHWRLRHLLQQLVERFPGA